MNKYKSQQLNDLMDEVSALKFLQSDPTVKRVGYVSQESIEVMLQLLQDEI